MYAGWILVNLLPAITHGGPGALWFLKTVNCMNIAILFSSYVEGCICRRRFHQDSKLPETGPPGGLAGVVPRRKDRVIINGLRQAVIIADNGNRKAQ
jgi:hypothetical protein